MSEKTLRSKDRVYEIQYFEELEFFPNKRSLACLSVMYKFINLLGLGLSSPEHSGVFTQRFLRDRSLLLNIRITCAGVRDRVVWRVRDPSKRPLVLCVFLPGD